MKKGLKIIDGLYINMSHIVTFEVTTDQLVLTTDSRSEWVPNTLHLTFEKGFSIGKKQRGFEVEGIIYVELQELHKIKREVCDYLGIDEPVLIK